MEIICHGPWNRLSRCDRLAVEKGLASIDTGSERMRPDGRIGLHGGGIKLGGGKMDNEGFGVRWRMSR